MDTKKSQYYEVIEYFDEGKVTEYQLTLSSGSLTYKLKGDDKVYKYTVPNVNLFLDDIHDSVHKYNKEHPDAPIKMDYEPGATNSWLFSILPTVLIMLALGAFTYLMIKKTNNAITSENNRAINFGKARVRHGNETDKVTFDDVAGADEEKEELQEIVEFLKDPEGFNKLGARIPKGVLLVGPPGTGKTLLAKAVAGEADAPFLSISGSDFVEMYVGVGASRVRDLFHEAKKSSPSIIFIDEIDAVGRHRGAGMGGGHDEREQTLNQLLVEMDGFAVNSGIIVIAATNRPDILDPALLRPGRFDRRVTVGYPDVKGREEILKVHSRKKPLGPDVDLHVIAATTAGFTGADLENLLNEAALLAAKRKLMAITMKEIQEATVKVVVGSEKKSHKMTDKEKRMTAYHEAGHAVSSYYLESQDPVQEVSIIPRGGAGGYTLYVPMEDKSYKYKKEMFEDIVSLLGGRVAEKIINDGDVSTGASNDIQRASEIARNMITKYGMSEKLGPISFGSGNDEVFLGKDYNHIRNYSEKVAAQIDEEVEAIMSEAYEKTQSILNAHFDKLTAVAESLIDLEKITGEQFRSIMETGALPAEESKEETVTDGTDPEEDTNTEENLSSEETGSEESATDFQESEDKKEE
ncbi:MAG: ATP-dependent zinc metalloprotease FtsH [Clostridiales bacterium]|nr:ATP-dependent zinc metalloprotease FtsH [Clostridiales bacterium]